MVVSKRNEGGSPKVQFNVYLPVDLVRDLKHRAIDEGVSLSALVERIASRYVATGSDGTASTEEDER